MDRAEVLHTTVRSNGKNAMFVRHKTALRIGLIALVVILHAAILFFIIPSVSYKLHASYNQDEYADGYDLLAANLANGHGYRMYEDTAPTLMREPGYPILLAGIFAVFGNTFAIVKLANMLMAFGVAWLMTRIARLVSDNSVMILGPPLIFLFHPAILVAESRGGVELLYTFCLTLFMCVLYAAFKSQKISHYVLSGAALGGTLLVRSVPILFPIFILAYLFVFERQAHRWFLIHVRNVALLIATMVIVLSPWIIRNYGLTGKFVPTASVVGVSAQTGEYILTHHAADDRRVDREAAIERNTLARGLGYPFREGYYQCFYSSADELKFSNFLLKRVFGDYVRSPRLFLKIAATNLAYFWVGGKNDRSIKINLLIQVPFLLLVILGVIVAVKDDQLKIVTPMILLVFYSIGVCVPILAQARYSVPMVPFLAILACISFTGVLREVRSDEVPSSEPEPVAVSA